MVVKPMPSRNYEPFGPADMLIANRNYVGPQMSDAARQALCKPCPALS